ncbi:MAG TPA: hypothetical protein VES19_16125 [Candidatus Limnocylindrales bacterium]|nr:hypothetical protein [Candidatus Limnocylindrales bacterium]
MTLARRARTPLAALAIVLALTATPALVSCTAQAPATVAPGTPVALESPVTGRLVKLEADGLTKVRGFTMRLDDGSEVAFTMGPVDNAADFPPGHLAEHMATSELVRVYYRDESGARVVYRLEDGE